MGAITDPIADMFTRIRNALQKNHQYVDIPCSNMKLGIAELLKKQGYIKDYKKIIDNKQGILRVFLKYTKDKKPAIVELKRISKPGCRIYRKHNELPYIHHGLGVAIISTPKGLMTDFEARRRRLGGEVIGSVF